jgi:hypothetical protein
VVIYTLWDAVFNSSKNLMKVGKDYIQCSWETTSPFWPLVHLDFLQTALSPLKGNLFPQDLRIYDFVPFIIVMCCRPMKSHPLNPVRPGQRRSWVILIRCNPPTTLFFFFSMALLLCLLPLCLWVIFVFCFVEDCLASSSFGWLF